QGECRLCGVGRFERRVRRASKQTVQRTETSRAAKLAPPEVRTVGGSRKRGHSLIPDETAPSLFRDGPQRKRVAGRGDARRSTRLPTPLDWPRAECRLNSV